MISSSVKDKELLSLAKDSDEKAINLLKEKYRKTLSLKVQKYSKNYSSNTKDFLNIAHLTLYTAIENYRDLATFSTYLNCCLDSALSNYCKSLNRHYNKILNEAISIDYNEISDVKNNPERILFDDWDYYELKTKIISKLTWKEELVFILKEQNFSNKEISEITDNNLKTVYNIIKRLQTKINSSIVK